MSSKVRKELDVFDSTVRLAVAVATGESPLATPLREGLERELRDRLEGRYYLELLACRRAYESRDEVAEELYRKLLSLMDFWEHVRVSQILADCAPDFLLGADATKRVVRGELLYYGSVTEGKVGCRIYYVSEHLADFNPEFVKTLKVNRADEGTEVDGMEGLGDFSVILRANQFMRRPKGGQSHG